MFGALAVPANSPHLRKSGSRAVVYDLGMFHFICKVLNGISCYFSLFIVLVFCVLLIQLIVYAVPRRIWGGKWCWWRFIASRGGKWFKGWWHNTYECFFNNAFAYFVVEIQGFFFFFLHCFTFWKTSLQILFCNVVDASIWINAKVVCGAALYLIISFIWSWFIFDSFGERDMK